MQLTGGRFFLSGNVRTVGSKENASREAGLLNADLSSGGEWTRSGVQREGGDVIIIYYFSMATGEPGYESPIGCFWARAFATRWD